MATIETHPHAAGGSFFRGVSEGGKKQGPPFDWVLKATTTEKGFQIRGKNKNPYQTLKNIPVHNLDPVANVTLPNEKAGVKCQKTHIRMVADIWPYAL